MALHSDLYGTPASIFAAGYGVIAGTGMGVSADKTGHIARPDIRLSQVRWWLHAEVADVAVAFLEGLIVAAHSRMVTAPHPVDAPSMQIAGDQYDSRPMVEPPGRCSLATLTPLWRYKSVGSP